MIRTKPPSDEYRDGWERIFGEAHDIIAASGETYFNGHRWQVGERATWHAPNRLHIYWPAFGCKCDQHGTVESVRANDSYVYVDRLRLDNGSVIDPSVSPDELTPFGAPCPWAGL